MRAKSKLTARQKVESLSGNADDVLTRLTASEQQHRLLFQANPSPMWVFDENTLRFVTVNDAALAHYGFTAEEFSRMSILDIRPPDEREKVQLRVAQLKGQDDHRQAVWRHQKKDGTIILAEVQSHYLLFDGSPCRLVLVRDVTERQKFISALEHSERRVQESESRLRFALDAAGIGDWDMDLVTNVARRSLRHDNCFGYQEPVAEWGYDTFLAHVHPDDREAVDRCYRDAMSGNGNYDIEFRAVWPDQTVHWLLSKGTFFFGEDGKPARAAGIQVEITRRVEDRQRLLLFERAIEAAPVGIIVTNARTQDQPITYSNPAFSDISGYGPEEILGSNCRFLQGKDADPAKIKTIREGLAKGEDINVVLKNHRKDGEMFWNQLRISPVRNNSGDVTHHIGIQADVTKLIESQEAVNRHAAQQSAVSSLGLYALSGQTLAYLYKTAARRVANTLGAEFVEILEPGANDESFHCLAAVDLHSGSSLEAQITLEAEPYATYVFAVDRPVLSGDVDTDERFAAGSRYHRKGLRSAASALIRGRFGRYGIVTALSVDANRFSDHDLDFLQGIANILAAAIERAQWENQLSFLAQHDPLTGLPNRTLMQDRLSVAIANAERNKDRLALLYLDLDRFKVINDGLGHQFGDALLKAVAERIREGLRGGDTISRQGGDEFTILIPGVGELTMVAAIAQKVLTIIAEPFLVQGREIFITASIGIAIYPDDAREQGELIRRADAALYRAKDEGRGVHQFFTPEINARMSERLEIESGLRTAIPRGEFWVVYQPKVETKSGRLVGVEALLRWRHPTMGIVAPDRFIPIAEEIGMIVPIGQWVLEVACRQAMQWRADGLGDLRMAVNLSARQFYGADLLQSVSRVLDETQFPANALEFEITESDIMRDPKSVIEQLVELKRLGVLLSVDDFGTGYSSLAYLRRFNLDVLKIDRSFIQDVTGDTQNASLVASIVAMAHGLGIEVVAEGVETQEQMALLREYDCDFIQGYLVAKPMEAQQFEEWLARQKH